MFVQPRREKISERIKLLQDLVPGCSKVTGKAVMLDEIINYVQSLQRKVEEIHSESYSLFTSRCRAGGGAAGARPGRGRQHGGWWRRTASRSLSTEAWRLISSRGGGGDSEREELLRCCCGGRKRGRDKKAPRGLARPCQRAAGRPLGVEGGGGRRRAPFVEVGSDDVP